MKLFISWFLRALSLIIVGALIPGIHISNFLAALGLVLVLSLLNFTVKPILFLFSLPITVLTFGLFTFVVNAVVFLLAGALVPGIRIDGFWTALVGSVLFSVVSSILEHFFES